MKKNNSSSDSYFNELYVTILYEPDKQGAALIEYLFTKIRQKSNKTAWENDMREMHESMQEMTTLVINTLRDYDSELLGVKKNQR